MHLSALLGSLRDWNDSFPYPTFKYLNLWNPYPFMYLNHKKGTKIWRTKFGRTLPIGHYREYPPPPRHQTQNSFITETILQLHCICENKCSKILDYILGAWMQITCKQTKQTKIFYSSITRLAVHKQSILNPLRQKGRRVRKAYWQWMIKTNTVSI